MPTCQWSYVATRPQIVMSQGSRKITSQRDEGTRSESQSVQWFGDGRSRGTFRKWPTRDRCVGNSRPSPKRVNETPELKRGHSENRDGSIKKSCPLPQIYSHSAYTIRCSSLAYHWLSKALMTSLVSIYPRLAILSLAAIGTHDTPTTTLQHRLSGGPSFQGFVTVVLARNDLLWVI